MGSKLQSVREAISDAAMMCDHTPVCVVLCGDRAMAGAVAVELCTNVSEDIAGLVRSGRRAGTIAPVLLVDYPTVSALVERLAQLDAGARRVRTAIVVIGDPAEPAALLWADIGAD